MKNYRLDLKYLIIGFFCVLAAFYYPRIIPARISSGLNDLSSWYTYKFLHKSARPYGIVSIAVDDHSLNSIPQRWPWKRSIYAKLIRILDKEKVKTVGIDFAFVGASEDKEEDRALRDAIKDSTSGVVLAYLFDHQKATPLLPQAEIGSAAHALGMVNTPVDADGKSRRLRAYVELEGRTYYSFPVAIASAFSGREESEIIAGIPLLRDKTFWVNFLISPADIIRISLVDCLNNLDALKERYGKDFLKDALILVHPEAEILHDTHFTPIGRMPGGILHLNGAVDIISGRLLKEVDILSVALLFICAAAIFYILKVSGFLSGAFFTLGVLVLNLWVLIFLGLGGIRFDYSRIFIFSVLFFFTSSLYRYIFFLSELLKIKVKATVDPLRGILTLRYFYYRLQLELEKIYFGRDLFLVVVYLGSLDEALEGREMEELKDIWRKINAAVSLRKSFWSFFSQEALCGGVVLSAHRIHGEVAAIAARLNAVFRANNLKVNVRCGSFKLKKERSVNELLAGMLKEIKGGREDNFSFSESDLARLCRGTGGPDFEKGGLLGTLYADIEEKNLQLLKFIEELNIEHAKTKEAFFGIITSLVHALEARDPYTEGHSQRVAQYSLKLAEKLGWGREDMEKLRKAALLHDLGKIGIPDNILHKRGALTEEEYNLIKQHEIIAVKILQPLKELKEILPWILYHHERWDGTGYPHGLAGEAIPEASQIIALCDVYDALSTGRDYKKAFSYEETSKLLAAGCGTQFNPQLLDTFIPIIEGKKREK